MRSLGSVSWGKPVAKLLSVGGKSSALFTIAAGWLQQFVDNIDNAGVFYQLFTRLILGLVHYFLTSLLSVRELVLQAVHSAYNNKQQVYLNLVINSRRPA
jgi:hypothetical protein